jgi:hypothetical protein
MRWMGHATRTWEMRVKSVVGNLKGRDLLETGIGGKILK